MRSLICSIQNDISYLSLNPHQVSQENKTLYLEKASHLASHIFPAIVTLAEKGDSFVSKYISNWIAEIPLQNENERFFKQVYWRWIRTLSTRIWDPHLEKPPLWVVEGGSSYCATLFQLAPSFWLQEYSYLLLERLYQETLEDYFKPAAFHYDYVEFIVRSMRKKSPFFASRSESLYALQLLSRLTRTEKTIINADVEAALGNNPITRALNVLVRLSKEIAKKS